MNINDNKKNQLSIAGKIFTIDEQDTAANCLLVPDRPTTPENVRRYRKSYFATPGAHIAHPGVIPDLQNIDKLKKFGVVTSDSYHVVDVLRTAPTTIYQEIKQQKAERIYTSDTKEQLGKSYCRGHQLPSHMQSKDFAFGITGKTSVAAKDLLYPSAISNSEKEIELYKRSHGSTHPGEQKNRQYDWKKIGIDPNKHRFGVKPSANCSALNAIGTDGHQTEACVNPELDEYYKGSANNNSTCMPNIAKKSVEEIRSTHDQLGRPRILGASNKHAQDPNHVYGMPRKDANEGSAWDCIHGNYSATEQQPDTDLGTHANPGWRNNPDVNRVFGVPTVRSDINIPQHRSIADSQNYGDDSSVKNLLYPEEFASNGVKDEEFAQPRSKTELCELFSSFQGNHDNNTKITNELELIWHRASKNREYASIADFRNEYNIYLEALNAGVQAVELWKRNTIHYKQEHSY